MNKCDFLLIEYPLCVDSVKILIKQLERNVLANVNKIESMSHSWVGILEKGDDLIVGLMIFWLHLHQHRI